MRYSRRRRSRGYGRRVRRTSIRRGRAGRLSFGGRRAGFRM